MSNIGRKKRLELSKLKDFSGVVEDHEEKRYAGKFISFDAKKNIY